MIMICNVPNEVVKSVKMGTWCGSSVAEKMIANGIPLDKIRAKIIGMTSDRGFLSCSVDHIHEEINAVFDKYKAESEKNDG